MIAMSMPAKSPGYKIQVLDRTFQALDALADQPAGMGVTELAVRLGLHKSTAHRILMVLEGSRYVSKDSASGKYQLGTRLMELGQSALSRLDVYEVARPHLRKLVAETGETAHMGVVRDGEVVSLVYVQSSQTLTTPSTVGARTPLYCSSIGKSILAFLPPAEIDEYLRGRALKPQTPATITSAKAFREELAVVRRQGYSLDDEEREPGLRCVGAPVRDSSGQVVAAISIAGPVFRITKDRLFELSSRVMFTAAQISVALGHSAPTRSILNQQEPS